MAAPNQQFIVGSPIEDRITDIASYNDTENREQIRQLETKLTQTNDITEKKLINDQITSLKSQTGIEGGRRRTNRKRRTKRRRTKRRKTNKRRRSGK